VLQATDPHGATVTLSFSVDVGNRAPTWTDLPPVVAASGTAVNYAPPPAVDPEGQAIIYSAVTGLPAGLVVDSATGRITGVAHTVGSFAVVLRAADPHRASVTRTVSLTYLFKPRDIKKERPKSAWAATLASFFLATNGVSNTTHSAKGASR